MHTKHVPIGWMILVVFTFLLIVVVVLLGMFKLWSRPGKIQSLWLSEGQTVRLNLVSLGSPNGWSCKFRLAIYDEQGKTLARKVQNLEPDPSTSIDLNYANYKDSSQHSPIHVQVEMIGDQIFCFSAFESLDETGRTTVLVDDLPL